MVRARYQSGSNQAVVTAVREVAQETVVQHAAQHTAAFEVQHRRQHLIAPAQHFAGSDDLGVSGQRKKGRWQHGSHCAVRLRLRH